MHGAAKANATAKAKSKAQAKALLRKTKAKGRVKKANTRKRARQTALLDINVLAREVGARPVLVKCATRDEVESLVRVLQRRFETAEQAPRLREPVQRWLDHGGQFSVPMEEAAAPDLDPPAVARHRLLLPGYRLQSKAFMLTYNNPSYTKDDWAAFREFITPGTLPNHPSFDWGCCT